MKSLNGVLKINGSKFANDIYKVVSKAQVVRDKIKDKHKRIAAVRDFVTKKTLPELEKVMKNKFPGADIEFHEFTNPTYSVEMIPTLDSDSYTALIDMVDYTPYKENMGDDTMTNLKKVTESYQKGILKDPKFIKDGVIENIRADIYVDVANMLLGNDVGASTLESFNAAEITAIILQEVGLFEVFILRVGSQIATKQASKKALSHFLDKSSLDAKVDVGKEYLNGLSKAEELSSKEKKALDTFVEGIDGLHDKIKKLQDAENSNFKVMKTLIATLELLIRIAVQMAAAFILVAQPKGADALWGVLIGYGIGFNAGVDLIVNSDAVYDGNSIASQSDLPYYKGIMGLVEREGREFVSRHGFMGHLASADEKLKMYGVARGFTGQASDAWLIQKGNIMLHHFNTMVFPEKMLSQVFGWDPPHKRFQVMKRDIIYQLKKHDVSPPDMEHYLQSIEQVEEHLKKALKTRKYTDPLRKLFSFIHWTVGGRIFTSMITGNQYDYYNKLVDYADKLQKNDLYVGSAKLDSLMKRMG